MTHTPLRPASSAVAEATPANANAGAAKIKHTKWWIAAGVLAVIAFAAGAYAMSRRDADPVAPPVAVLAQSGSDGALAFTVTGSTCGVRTVGPAVLTQRPTAGQFCLVDVTVRNLGTEPELLDPGAQHAIDGQGRQYPISDRAAVFLNDRNPSLLEEIPAGATVPGVLAFDVPADVLLGSVVLHESVTSTGVRLPLS